MGNSDAGNYTEVETDGTLVARGEATCWRDELQSLVGQRLFSSAGRIDYNYTEGTVDFDSNANEDDYVLMNVQINHDWDEVTGVRPHIHWFQSEDATPNWLMQHRWQRNGEAKVTAWTDVPCNNPAFTYTSGTIINICNFGSITPPEDVGTSSILQIRLIRDTSNDSGEFAGADPYTGTVPAINFDVHIPVDMLGSRQEFIK